MIAVLKAVSIRPPKKPNPIRKEMLINRLSSLKSTRSQRGQPVITQRCH